MKLIFLDIDGVLNSEEFAVERYNLVKSGKNNGRIPFIDKRAVDLLVQFLSAHTDVKIVLSSSWRCFEYNQTIEQFCDERYEEILPLLKYIIGITPRFKGVNDDGEALRFSCRGEEIQEFLNVFYKQKKSKYEECLFGPDFNGVSGIESYVIIDDDDDMLDSQKENSFIQTDPTIGLTAKNIDMMILKLYSNTNISFFKDDNGVYNCPKCGL